MSASEVEAIVARLDKIEDSLIQLHQTTSQLSQTTAKLEGINATIQKMLGWGLGFVGVLAAAGLFRLFVP